MNRVGKTTSVKEVPESAMTFILAYMTNGRVRPTTIHKAPKTKMILVDEVSRHMTPDKMTPAA